jgi:hypothetical protein
VPTTIYDATDNDIWPDPAGRPPLAMREEIRRVAQNEVTEEDIESLSFAPWYAKFYVAQGIVRARMDVARTEPSPAPALDPGELQQIRRRLAKLERMVIGENATLLKAVGTVLGEAHGEIEQRLKALEDREPIALPSADDVATIERGPGLYYCGLWNATTRYAPGAMVTKDGAAWIAMTAMAAGTKPGDGPTGWRLAVKSDTASLRAIVKDEVKKQLGGRTPASRTVTVR